MSSATRYSLAVLFAVVGVAGLILPVLDGDSWLVGSFLLFVGVSPYIAIPITALLIIGQWLVVFSLLNEGISWSLGFISANLAVVVLALLAVWSSRR